MFNPVTDRIKLVEEIVISGRSMLGKMPLPLFDQVLPAINGFNQEVFRNGAYLGSVHPTNFPVEKANSLGVIHPIKVRRGDIIYRITLAPQPYHFPGTVQSKDKYQRIYDMSIVLMVNNTTRVIEWYHQSKDPAGWVINRFKENFEQWASSIEHDKLSSAKPSWDNITQLLSNQCGIRITQPRWSFRADLIRGREWEIRQHAELRKVEIEKEHEIKSLEEQLRREREIAQKDFDRDEKSKQNEFVRAEKLKNRRNEAYMQLLSETVKELMTMNRERIREALDYNRSVKGVLQDSLRLLNVFSGSVPENEEVIDSMPSYDDISLEDKEGVNAPDTAIDLPILSLNETDDNIGKSFEPPL